MILDRVKKHLSEKDKTITGFNVRFNDVLDVLDAGQTIFHCHIHVIPRKKDVLDPTGGIQNIIPRKGTYN